MPIYLGAPMDENPPGAGPSVIFTATYALRAANTLLSLPFSSGSPDAGQRPESGVRAKNLDCAPQAPLHPGYTGYTGCMRSSYRWTSSWYLRWLRWLRWL
jgi:hypothetical protein